MSVTTTELLLALRRPLLIHQTLLPDGTRQAWQGKRTSKDAGKAFVEDSIVPATATLSGHALMRAYRVVTGLYLLQWYGVAGQGAALYATADAVVALYPPGTSFVTSEGNAVTVRDNPAPWVGQAREVNGRTLITITIPYTCTTIATEAAS